MQLNNNFNIKGELNISSLNIPSQIIPLQIFQNKKIKKSFKNKKKCIHIYVYVHTCTFILCKCPSLVQILTFHIVLQMCQESYLNVELTVTLENHWCATFQ